MLIDKEENKEQDPKDSGERGSIEIGSRERGRFKLRQEGRQSPKGVDKEIGKRLKGKQVEDNNKSPIKGGSKNP